MLRFLLHHWQSGAYGVRPHMPTGRLLQRLLYRAGCAALELRLWVQAGQGDLNALLQRLAVHNDASGPLDAGSSRSREFSGDLQVQAGVLQYLTQAGPRRAIDIHHFLTAQRRFQALELEEVEALLTRWERQGVLSTLVQEKSDWQLFGAVSPHRSTPMPPANPPAKAPKHADHAPRRTRPLLGELEFSIPAHRFASYVGSLQRFLVSELAELEREEEESAEEGPWVPVRATLWVEPVHLHGEGHTAVLQLFTTPTPKASKLM